MGKQYKEITRKGTEIINIQSLVPKTEKIKFRKRLGGESNIWKQSTSVFCFTSVVEKISFRKIFIKILV